MGAGKILAGHGSEVDKVDEYASLYVCWGPSAASCFLGRARDIVPAEWILFVLSLTNKLINHIFKHGFIFNIVITDLQY